MNKSLSCFSHIGKNALLLTALSASLQAGAQTVTRFHLGVIVLPRYGTIDSAINAASVNDSLVLSPNTFKEHNIEISKNIKLTGTTDAAGNVTIIDAEHKGRGFIVYSGDLDLQNLTLQNGSVTDGAGGGIYNIGSGVISLSGTARVTNNACFGIYANGGGIYAAGRVIVGENAVVSNNYAQETGGGIYGFEKVIVRGSGRIANNKTDGSGGGIFSTANAGLMLTDNGMIDNNSAVEAGGGAYGSGTVSGYAMVKNNRAAYGGGIAAFDDALFLQDSSWISSNTATTYGGGIWTNNCDIFGTDQFHVTNNTIPAVTGTLNFGGAIYNVNGNMTLYGGTVTGNTSPVAAIYNSAGSQPMSVTINACHIYNPAAGGIRMPEVYNSPALDPTALTFTSGYVWWGSNDTTGLVKDRPGTYCGRMTNYATISWHLNKDVPITPSIKTFRVQATLEGSDGSSLDTLSYRSISGIFSATKGSFSVNNPAIDTDNHVWSQFSAPSKNDTTVITGIVDADTFRSSKIYLIGLDITENTLADGISIYPNPASEILYLKNSTAGSVITVSDLNGRCIIRQAISVTGTASVNIQSLRAGMYLLQVATDDRTQAVARFVKQ
ncbi:MAG: T9SS type A sorting domain-containing protein [Chitinophagaceae bacterium]